MLNTEHQTLSAQLEEHLAKLRSTASVFSTMCEHASGVLTPDALRETAHAMYVVSRLAYDTAKSLHKAQHPDTTRLVTLGSLTGSWPLDLKTEHDAQINAEFPTGPKTLAEVRRALDIAAGSVPKKDPS